MSMSMIVCRYLHTGRVLRIPQAVGVQVEKSALAKLRKSTGYSFSKCKEALEKHQNDLKESEKWLRSQAQAHGWEKATKLQGRATAQGLVSILASPHNAVMVEINCETDFVARNKKFQSLVQRITQGCYGFSANQQQSSPTLVSKLPLHESELSTIETIESRLAKDEVALSIGEIGENIKARRAVCVRSSGQVLLAGYTHPASLEAEKEVVQYGKFGAIVAYKVTEEPNGAASDPSNKPPLLAEVGRQLCQHIVGMNPTEIGSIDAPPPRKEKQKVEEESSTPKDTVSVSDDGHVQIQSPETPEVDETILLNQEFLLDPDLTVREFLIQNSIEVIDFVRFECGENLSES